MDARDRARPKPDPVTAADVAALHASLDPSETAREAARLLVAAGGARSCGVWADEDGVVALAGAVRTGDGVEVLGWFAGSRPRDPDALSRVLADGRPEWVDADVGDGLAPAAGGGRVLLLPLRDGAGAIAVAALVDATEVAGAEAAAALAGTALGNAVTFARQGAELADAEERVERLDVLHDLGAVLADRGGSKVLVDRVNRLLSDRDLEVDSLAWKSRLMSRRVGGSGLLPQERSMLRDGEAWTALPDGRLAVPMRVGRKHVGSMRVRSGSPPGDAELRFLELLAAGVGEVANRISLRAEIEEAARGTALAHERDRIAADLHDTVGQLFVAIQVLARREAEKLPRASEPAARFHRLADLANQGKWEIDHALDALTFFPAARHGLAPAIRAFAESFHSDAELDVIVDVYGRPARLPAAAERALYRVVHESLTNAQRVSRCSAVRIALSFERERVHLSITDDGTGLTETIPDRGRTGTSHMRRAVTEAGGTFRLRNGKPRGAIVEAEIPRDRR